MWEILKEIMLNKKNVGVLKIGSLFVLKFNYFFIFIVGKLCEWFWLSIYIKLLILRVNNKFFMEEVNEMFVCDELKRFKLKVIGLDGMFVRFLKDVVFVIVKFIIYIINLIILIGEILFEFKEVKVMFIFKNGKRIEESNYRFIFVLFLVFKVMECVI